MKVRTLFISLLLLLSSPHAVLSYSKNQPSAESQGQKNSKKVISEAGLNIPQWGIAIDAVYDSRLDNLVPGYKILNVILSNRSASSIFLDPKKDKWYIVDNIGKTIHGITHLRLTDEHLWMKLPNGLREKLEYPQTVRVAHSAKIDLFFPMSATLENFREIGWESSHFKKEFNVINAVEKNLDDGRNEPLPNTPTYKQSQQKYDSLDPLIQKPRDPNEAPPPVEYDIKKDRVQERPPVEMRDIPSIND